MIEKRCIICKSNFLCYNPPYEKRNNKLKYNKNLALYARTYTAITCSKKCSKHYMRLIPRIRSELRSKYNPEYVIV